MQDDIKAIGSNGIADQNRLQKIEEEFDKKFYIRKTAK